MFYNGGKIVSPVFNLLIFPAVICRIIVIDTSFILFNVTGQLPETIN